MSRPPKISSAIEKKLKETRIARLATLGPDATPHLVPVCFVYDGKVFYSAIDRKPKRTPPAKLARLRHIRATPRVALLLDEYHENWNRLWYILVRGTAALIPQSAGKERRKAVRKLRAKYRQYAAGMLPDDAPIIRIVPRKIVYWGQI
jgi:PPOX class probable F420-dependent enzyme